jgi:hypothetical protein
MNVIVTVVEKLKSEAHINIPDGMSEPAIKQHITDLYNSGDILIDLNIFQVEFQSISARIVFKQASTTSNLLGEKHD